MTERRRAHHRRHYRDHLLGGAGLAVLIGAAVVIGFDAAGRNSDLFRTATFAGNSRVPASSRGAASSSPASNHRSLTQAGLLPGEIVIESAGDLPQGTWRLGDVPVAAPPVLLDSVSAGSHQLSFLEGDSVRWGVRIDLAPGGIEHVVVPSLGTPDSVPGDATRATSAPADSLER